MSDNTYIDLTDRFYESVMRYISSHDDLPTFKRQARIFGLTYGQVETIVADHELLDFNCTGALQSTWKIFAKKK